MPSRRPLHCLQCNLLLLILAVGENSFSEYAAETSRIVLESRGRPQPALGSFGGEEASALLSDTFALLQCLTVFN